jgi:ATP-dependent Zn protease
MDSDTFIFVTVIILFLVFFWAMMRHFNKQSDKFFNKQGKNSKNAKNSNDSKDANNSNTITYADLVDDLKGEFQGILPFPPNIV